MSKRAALMIKLACEKQLVLDEEYENLMSIASSTLNSYQEMIAGTMEEIMSDLSDDEIIEDSESEYEPSISDSNSSETISVCEVFNSIDNHDDNVSSSNVTNISELASRKSSITKQVKLIQSLKAGSKQRKCLIQSLRKQGYFYLKTEKNVLHPVRTSNDPDVTYFVCTYCLGHYSKKLLHKHVKICKNKPKDEKHVGKRCLSKSQTFMALVNSKNEEFLKKSRIKDEVFGIMRPDNISYVAKNDALICLYGESILNKHKRKQIINVVSNKMREMGRLLISLRETEHFVGLFDVLKPEMFQTLINATKQISGYDANEKCFKSPSLVLHMGINLKILCNIGLKIVLENRKMHNIDWTDRDKKKEEIKDLKKLIEGHWCNELSSLALKNLKEKHWEKPVELPLNSDIQLLISYVGNLAAKSFNNLNQNVNILLNFKTLSECVLVETLMFNRKRVGEIQYLRIETYKVDVSTVNQESFMDSLTQVEKLISKRFKRVISGGKGFKPIPILFSNRLQQYIDCMLKTRKKYNLVPESNPYLFANSDSENRWINGAYALRKLAKKCDAKQPSLLTSTKFRKHIATTLQLMSMKDDEMEQIATFMGHTKKTHLEFYRLPQDIYQTAKVAKVLLLLEKGRGKEFKGKSLNEIELDTNVYCSESETDIEEEEDEEEKSLADRVLDSVKIKKQEIKIPEFHLIRTKKM
ncbi:unnamed protein product [Brassicogethes aeneus]|uniref:Uncharacterized protein n=1 Tax=Brassicogethes aeneus TaxID=1431903 RepID=A0A9P0BA87_BRAAE|nr:unnamed protein product [Brassicogethes aeneus]